MLRQKDRGPRKTRRTLALLLATVALIMAVFWSVRTLVECELHSTELARKAAEAAKRRKADSTAHLEEARRTLAADAPIPRDWTIQRVSGAFDPQRNADLALLSKLARALLARDPVVRRGNYDIVKTYVAQAVSSSSATEFERAIAKQTDSESAVLHAAHDYIAALRPLQEAEQALALGLFDLSDQETAPALPQLLADLVALRALGELQAEEPRKAVESTLHAYQFLRAMNEPRQLVHAFALYAKCCHELDWLFERSVDALWMKEPLGEEDRERAIAIIGWQPSKEEMMAALYACVLPTHAEGTVLSVLRHPLDALARPIRTQGALELITKLEPAVADDHYDGPGVPAPDNKDGCPQWAYTTRQVRADVWLLDNAWRARGARAALTRLVFTIKDYRRGHGKYPERSEIPMMRVPKAIESYGYVRKEGGFFFEYHAPGAKEPETVWEGSE